MRLVASEKITEAVAEMCQAVNFDLAADVLNALNEGLEKEESPIGEKVLRQLLDNASAAKNDRVGLCQDTGLAVVFVELGQEVALTGASLNEAVNLGVSRGYRDGYLRKSIVKDPFCRTNTGDNTPAIVHVEIVPGDVVRITLAAKGGGSENMSALKMLPPSAGKEGVEQFVLDTVEAGGPNACPPLVIGVGIGGNFEYAPMLAKKALLRPLDSENPDPELAAMEKRLLERINRLGIGPSGFGGLVGALKVFVEAYPCHIASLPAAVNIDCHCHRHASRII